MSFLFRSFPTWLGLLNGAGLLFGYGSVVYILFDLAWHAHYAEVVWFSTIVIVCHGVCYTADKAIKRFV